MAEKGQKQRKHSAEYKISVIMDMREHRLGFRETARKYGLVIKSESAAADTVQSWKISG